MIVVGIQPVSVSVSGFLERRDNRFEALISVLAASTNPINRHDDSIAIDPRVHETLGVCLIGPDRRESEAAKLDAIHQATLCWATRSNLDTSASVYPPEVLTRN